MDIAKRVALFRLKYHANMASVVNVANQFGIVNDVKANELNKNHFMQALECARLLGHDVDGYLQGKYE